MNGCTIIFAYGSVVGAMVYRHGSGGPNRPRGAVGPFGPHGVLADLDRFFADVEEQAPDDTRFTHPTYLAARFVVWQASRFCTRIITNGRPSLLNFVGVGVVQVEPTDTWYRYHVNCSMAAAKATGSRPRVGFQKRDQQTGDWSEINWVDTSRPSQIEGDRQHHG